MGKFKCHSPKCSCTKQHGTVLCSHNHRGTLTNSACGQSVDFIGQYELMTREQSHFLHLVKSTIVKGPPRADSERLPAPNSWAQPPFLDSSRSFPACKGFSQHHYLFRLHLSWQGCSWAGFAHTAGEVVSKPLFSAHHLSEHLASWASIGFLVVPGRKSDFSLTGGFALPNAAFSSWHTRLSTGLFQIKTESRVPSPKYYMAQIFTALSSLTRWSIWWLFRTQPGLFSRICCRNGWSLPSLKTFLTFKSRQDYFAASFLQHCIPCRGE